MKEYTFDISKVKSLDDWWEMYIKIVQGPDWEGFGRNRDAYSDSLDGGPGCPVCPCRFVFTHMGKVQYDDLVKWTKGELTKNRQQCHPSAIPLIDKQIELLEYGKSETLHHWVLDPVLGHENIEVVVKHGA